MCLSNLTNWSLFNHLILPTQKRRKYHQPQAKTDMTLRGNVRPKQYGRKPTNAEAVALELVSPHHTA